MPTSSFNKFNSFVEYLGEKEIDLQNDVFKVAFVAAANAPSASLDLILTDIVQATTNADSITLTVSSASQSGGTYSVVWADKVITATTGGIGPFRYVVVYDDSTTTPDDILVCYYDYGSDITVALNETFTLNFGATAFTIA